MSCGLGARMLVALTLLGQCEVRTILTIFSLKVPVHTNSQCSKLYQMHGKGIANPLCAFSDNQNGNKLILTSIFDFIQELSAL